MKPLTTLLVSAGIGLLAIGTAGLLILNQDEPPEIAVPNTGPSRPTRAVEFQLPSLAGRMVKLSDFRGRVVLLNFWATWCPPCREEMPALKSLAHAHKSQGLTVIGISMDQNAAVVKAYAEEAGLDFPLVMGTPKVAAAYGAVGLPTTVIIDREGNAVQGLVGRRSREEFAAVIEPLL